MLIKKTSYVYKQIAYGLLGLRCIVDEKSLRNALSNNDPLAAKKALEDEISIEHQEIFNFIFEDLFSTEEDTERIREIYSGINSIDKYAFVDSYRYQTVNKSGDYTNGCIEELAASIIADKNPSNVLDMCSGQAIFLTKAFLLNSAPDYYGIEINRENALISKIKCLILGVNPDRIKTGDVFDSKFDNKSVEKYDAIFCHMPIKMPIGVDKILKADLLDEFHAKKINRLEPEWAFIKAMIAMINNQRQGIGVAWVRSSLLYSEVGKEFRRDLIKRNLLEGIILLPPGMLNNSGIQTALMIIQSNNGTIKMIDASNWAVSGRRANYIPDGEIPLILDLYDTGGEHVLRPEDPPCCTTVSIDEISDNDYSFEPTRYILKKHLRLQNEVILSDVTTNIFRGVQIKSDDHDTMSELYGSNPNCYLLNLSNISNGYIDDNLEEVNIDNLKKYQRYMVQLNDVVISARGTRISIAVADNIENRDVICTGNLITIRCGNKLDPYYLKAFFESNYGTSILKSIQTGSTIFAINPRQLQEMPIELLEYDKQKIIGEKEKWMIGELRGSTIRAKTIKEKLTHLFDDSKEV